MAGVPHGHAVAGDRIPLVWVEPVFTLRPEAPRRLCIWQPVSSSGVVASGGGAHCALRTPLTSIIKLTVSSLVAQGFSGAKESVLPRLRDLAEDGFVAVCFDAPDHGERLIDADASALGTRVRSNLRR
jgi:hypothetical protein